MHRMDECWPVLPPPPPLNRGSAIVCQHRPSLPGLCNRKQALGKQSSPIFYIVLPSALPQLSPCGSVIANGNAGVNVCILIPHASDPLQPEGIILA